MFGAADPPRHAEGLELLQRCLEQRPRALAIAADAAPCVHQRLVVVDDGAQRACTLLVENDPRLREPVDRIVMTISKRAQAGEAQPAVDHGMMEKCGVNTF